MFQIPIQPILVYLLILIRVTLFMAFLPVFSDLLAPTRVRMLLAMGIAMVFAPVANVNLHAFPQTLPAMLMLMAPEAALGMAFGLVGRLGFAAVQFGGEIMGEQIGFGMANLMDPSQNREVPVVAEFFYIVSLLLFFVTNAYQAFFAALGRSFELVPPGAIHLSRDLTMLLCSKVSEMFLIGVQMSLPIVAAIFTTNVAMGMVSKGVPQLNVFVESFSVRIILGLALLSIIAGFLVRIMNGMFDDLTRSLGAVLGTMAK
jgi:flagellar biosynthesis protein FliR